MLKGVIMINLTIGKIAAAANVGVETIRFYERKGLLKKPVDKVGAFRIYSKDSISKIKFIKKAQDLGFTLKEIKELITLDHNIKSTCFNVAKKTETKLKEVKDKIQNLKKIESALEKLLNACLLSPEAKACCKVSDCFENKCS